jgi:hypothetical protein
MSKFERRMGKVDEFDKKKASDELAAEQEAAQLLLAQEAQRIANLEAQHLAAKELPQFKEIWDFVYSEEFQEALKKLYKVCGPAYQRVERKKWEGLKRVAVEKEVRLSFDEATEIKHLPLPVDDVVMFQMTVGEERTPYQEAVIDSYFGDPLPSSLGRVDVRLRTKFNLTIELTWLDQDVVPRTKFEKGEPIRKGSYLNFPSLRKSSDGIYSYGLPRQTGLFIRMEVKHLKEKSPITGTYYGTDYSFYTSYEDLLDSLARLVNYYRSSQNLSK